MKRQVLLLFTVFLSMIPILVKAQHEGRFLFCAALPLPDVDAAIREAVYALDTLHADGVKLASNSRGLYLGDPALDPLMEVLNEHGALSTIESCGASLRFIPAIVHSKNAEPYASHEWCGLFAGSGYCQES